jgi:hypothetical protein
MYPHDEVLKVEALTSSFLRLQPDLAQAAGGFLSFYVKAL